MYRTASYMKTGETAAGGGGVFWGVIYPYVETAQKIKQQKIGQSEKMAGYLSQERKYFLSSVKHCHYLFRQLR